MRITTTKFKGFNALTKSLDALTENDFRKKALITAGRLAMKPLLNDVISAAPVLSHDNQAKSPDLVAGALKNDIKYRGQFSRVPVTQSRGKNSGSLTARTRHEFTGKITTGKASEEYILPIEYGRSEFTVMRMTVFGKKVDPFEATVVELKPNPFMRTTFDNHKDSVISRYMDELSSQIIKKAKAQEKYIKKNSK